MSDLGIFERIPVAGGRASMVATPADDDLGVFGKIPIEQRGNVSEAGRAVARGGVGMLGNVASGVSELMPESAPDLGIGRFGKSVTGYAQERFAPTPGREGEYGVNKIPEALGGMAVGAAPIAIGGAVGTPGSGLAIGAGLFGLGGAGQAGAEAEAMGATPGQRQAAAAAGGAANAALAFVPGGQITRGAARLLPSLAERGVVGGLGRTGAAAAEGAAIGAGGQVVNNEVARQTYDPNRSLGQGVGEAAAVTGAAAGILHPMIGRGAERRPLPPEAPPQPEAPMLALPPPSMPMYGPEGPPRAPEPGPLALPPPRTPDVADRAFIAGQHAAAGGVLGPNTGPGQFVIPDRPGRIDLTEGDSIGVGFKKFGGLPGNPVGGRNPQAVFDNIQANLASDPDYYRGRTVLLSSGTMNDARGAMTSVIPESIRAIQAAGGRVVLAGADTGKFADRNEILAGIAEQHGVPFAGPLPTDNVHPGPEGYRNYARQATRLAGGGETAPGSVATERAPTRQGDVLDLIAKYESRSRPMIGWGETDLSGYRLTDTGFPDWPGKPGPKGNSTAAGLFQITRSTWDPIARQLGIKDFSVESQRRVAQELLRTRGLDPWAPHNPKLAEALRRGEVGEPIGAGGGRGGSGAAAPDVPGGAAAMASGADISPLPRSESIESSLADILPKKPAEEAKPAAQQTPFERAMNAVSRLNPGDPVTTRLLAQLAGLRSKDQIATLRDRMLQQGVVKSENGRYYRAETANKPEVFSRPAPSAAETQANIAALSGPPEIPRAAPEIPSAQPEIPSAQPEIPIRAPEIQQPVRPVVDASVLDGGAKAPTAPSVAEFRTAKGSVYQLHDDATTTRDKAYRPEHGVDEQGIQPRSEKTIYVSSEDANKLGEFQARGGGARAVAPLGDGRWGVKYLDGKDAGKFEKRTVIEPKDEPAVGLTPVEIWKGGERVHFGNEITEVKRAAEATQREAGLKELPLEPTQGEVPPSRPGGQSGNGSWVIVDKKTGKAVHETFDEKAAGAVNRDLYDVVPTLDYLQDYNRRVKEAGGVEPPSRVPPEAAQRRPGLDTAERPALRDELYRLVRERAPSLRLRTLDELVGTIEGRASPIHGADQTETRPGGLLEHNATSARGGPDPRAALSHEIVHFFRRSGMFTRPEWEVLSRKADKWAEQFKTDERYKDQPLGIRREEAVAEAYAAWDRGDMQQPPGIRRIFGKLKDFFDRVGNFLRGQGFQNAEDVFGRMTSGEVGARELDGMATPEALHARPAATPADERVEAALRQIRVTPDERPLQERTLGFVKQAMNRIRDEARYATVDSFDPIAKLEKGANRGELLDASVSAFKAAHLSRELPAMMSQVVGLPDGKGGFIGGVPMLKDGAYVTNPDSKPLSAVLKPIFDAGLQKPFELWMAVTRAKRLMAEGRENLISPEVIAEFKDLDRQHLGPNGENLFRETQKEWIAFNKRLLDFAEQTGLVNKEQRGLWERGDYVPFFRNMGEEVPIGPGKGARGIANQNSGIKALKGGEEKLNSLYENMFTLSESLVGRAVKNEAARRTRDLAEPLAAMEKVSLSEKMTEMGKRRGDNIVSVMDGGKQQYYRVTQPLLLKAISDFGPLQAEGITKWLGLPKKLLTMAVTHEPTFMAANLMRDTLHSWVITGSDFKPGLDTAKGAIAALRNSPEAMALMAGGGGGRHFYEAGPKGAKGWVRGLNGEWTPLTTIKTVWGKLEDVGSASEMANRIAIYEAALKRGDSNAEAIWQAKDLLNFTASGGSQLMKFLIQTVPFMNARIQGLDRLQRGARENPASFLMRGGLITAASLGLWAMNKDNPEYQKLPDFEKQSYWHLFLPGFTLRIPKPFEVGAIFGSVPEMLGDFADNGNWNQLWRAFVANGTQQLNLFQFPQAIAPAYDVATNTNSLTQGPIVNQAEKHLVPGERFGPTTSSAMIVLGQQLGVSPDQLEYLFKGYTGTLGGYLLSATNALTDLGTGKTRPDTRLDQYPLVSRFIRTEPQMANRWVNGFYDVKTEIDQLHATMGEMVKQGRAAEAQQLVKDNMDKLGLRGGTQAIGTQLATVRKAMKAINDAPSLSSEEKRARLDQLIAVRNQIGESARQIVERARP